MSVITISREYGSEGEAIAERIAGILHYHLVDKEFIAAVLDKYGLVEFNQEYDSLPGFWDRFMTARGSRRDVIADMLDQVLRAVAYHGDVIILGRSGFVALGGFADVLHVRLQAPYDVRVARVRAKSGMTAQEAEAAVTESDRVRETFVEEFYKVEWGAAQAFDLVIDTGAISPDLAVTWVVEAAKGLAEQPKAGMPGAGAIEVDPTLDTVVCRELGCEVDHR
jgi:cytidylate kinase